MRLVCISDTHARHAELALPAGDVLLHAGDFTRRGSERDILDFDAWLAEQPHAHKLVVAGNHDFLFERAPERAEALLRSALYLRDSGVELEGVRFWGSPWQPEFHRWAFNLERGAALAAVWARIPDDTDVLITHGPPRDRLDTTARGEAVGCDDLLERVRALRPALHVFGHIHEAAGVLRDAHTTYANACSLNLAYEPAHAPLLFDLERDAQGRLRVESVATGD